jgi:hypothetical protein
MTSYTTSCTTSYLARILLIALVMCAAIPISGFSQSGDQSQNTVDVVPTTAAEREIAAQQGQDFVLGDIMGVAYFTSESGGLRLVATVKNAEGSPVRFVATLAPDQSAIVSVPGKVGEEASEVSFVRRGERVIVKTSPHVGN